MVPRQPPTLPVLATANTHACDSHWAGVVWDSANAIGLRSNNDVADQRHVADLLVGQSPDRPASPDGDKVKRPDESQWWSSRLDVATERL